MLVLQYMLKTSDDALIPGRARRTWCIWVVSDDLLDLLPWAGQGHLQALIQQPMEHLAVLLRDGDDVLLEQLLLLDLVDVFRQPPPMVLVQVVTCLAPRPVYRTNLRRKQFQKLSHQVDWSHIASVSNPETNSLKTRFEDLGVLSRSVNLPFQRYRDVKKANLRKMDSFKTEYFSSYVKANQTSAQFYADNNTSSNWSYTIDHIIIS